MKHEKGPMPEALKHLPIEERTQFLQYNKKCNIDKTKLQIFEDLGSGQYGVVKKGVLETKSRNKIPVAVKS